MIKRITEEELKGKASPDFWVRLDEETVFHIQEGTGDNLTEEDVENGYNDYVYYDVYHTDKPLKELAEADDMDADDGGEALTEKLYVDMTLQEVLDAAFGLYFVNYESKDFGLGLEIYEGE